MIRLLARRAVYAVLTVAGVLSILFTMLHLTGDPAEVYLSERASDEDLAVFRDAHGLDDPLLVQYGRFIVDAAQGDFGESLRLRRPATEAVLDAAPKSAQLAGVAIAIGLLVGIPVGVVAAYRRGTVVDSGLMAVSLLGFSVPVFVLGLALSLVLGVKLGWFPVSGRGSFSHLVLPGATIGLGLAGSLARVLRSNLADALSEDYIRTARAKGCSWGRVVVSHALRNASLPTITVIGLQLALVLTGVFIVEVIYAYPGLGRLTIDAINGRDFPVVLASIALSSIVYVVVNVLVDLLYGVVDPRIDLRAHR